MRRRSGVEAVCRCDCQTVRIQLDGAFRLGGDEFALVLPSSTRPRRWRLSSACGRFAPFTIRPGPSAPLISVLESLNWSRVRLPQASSRAVTRRCTCRRRTAWRRHTSPAFQGSGHGREPARRTVRDHMQAGQKERRTQANRGLRQGRQHPHHHEQYRERSSQDEGLAGRSGALHAHAMQTASGVKVRLHGRPLSP